MLADSNRNYFNILGKAITYAHKQTLDGIRTQKKKSFEKSKLGNVQDNRSSSKVSEAMP